GVDPIASLRSETELIECPSIVTIASPATMPAAAAAEWDCTPTTSAPPLLADPYAPATCTPSRPWSPMCTVALARPDSIWRAIDSAASIGMAYAVVVAAIDAVDIGRKPPLAAAVVMPITCPYLLTVAPPESPGCTAAEISINPL